MKKQSYSPDQSLYEDIVNTYLDSGSVKATCEKSGASEVTVRRVLITEGLWSSKTSKRIASLMDRGMSIEEVAAELSVTKNAVEAYLPYSRGKYGMSGTENAQNSKKYRDRVTEAQKAVCTLTADEKKSIAKESPALKDKMASSSGKAPLKESPEISGQESSDLVLKLHLELVDYNWDEPSEDLGLKGEEREEFLTLAKAKKGISRDILVPGNMNLHALHYAIQRLFGWQNSHLHRFFINNNDFDEMTGGKFGAFAQLCGSLFRFPDDDSSDFYWDDDYKDNISVKSWLKKKYSAPFRCGSIGESYLGNKWGIEDFLNHFSQFSSESTLKSIDEAVFMGETWNCLIERLSVGELFLPQNQAHKDAASWKADILHKGNDLTRELENARIDQDDLRSSADELREWRKSADQLDQLKWMFPNTFKEEVKKRTGESYEEVVAAHREELPYWKNRCMKFIRDWNVALEPYFSELYYEYDYGDSWCVRITVTDRQNDPLTAEALQGAPLCVQSDGMNLVDDCGGIGGYLKMLRVLNGKDSEEKAEMRAWARSLGWTGRLNRPEKML